MLNLRLNLTDEEAQTLMSIVDRLQQAHHDAQMQRMRSRAAAYKRQQARYAKRNGFGPYAAIARPQIADDDVTAFEQHALAASN
jgi:hypothetical protein